VNGNAGSTALRRLLIVAVSATLALAGGGANAASERLPGRIVFTSKRDGDDELYVMRADGSDRRRLTMNESSDDTARRACRGCSLIRTAQES
jgi:hypothetical protein